MPTLDLHEAAQFLRMSPAVLRLHARQGRLKAAKPGKRWVFLEADLAAYLGELYAHRRQAPLSGSNPEESVWGYTNAVVSGEPPRESRRLVGVSHAAMASSRCC